MNNSSWHYIRRSRSLPLLMWEVGGVMAIEHIHMEYEHVWIINQGNDLGANIAEALLLSQY